MRSTSTPPAIKPAFARTSGSTAGKPLLRLLFALSASLFTSSCAGILPVPPLSRELISGEKVKSSAIQFITPGVTTRKQVEQRLGPCTRESPRARAVAYTWEAQGWSIVGWACGPYGGGASGSVPVGGWKALLLAFDEQDRVRKAEIVTLSHRRSLDDQVIKWAGR